jgi:hypothetical protein
MAIKENKMKNNEILTPLAKRIIGEDEKKDLLDQFKIDKKINEISQNRDIYHDAPRDHFDIAKHDSMDSMLRAASFLKKKLSSLNIPILSYKYESMNVEKWANDRNIVDKGEAKFIVDVLNKEGAKKTLSIPIIFEKGEIRDPEYFLDSMGRKYAFSKDGIEEYIVEDDEKEVEDTISFNETNDITGRQPGEEPALANLEKNIKQAIKYAEGSDNIEDAAFKVINLMPIGNLKVYAGILAGKFDETKEKAFEILSNQLDLYNKTNIQINDNDNKRKKEAHYYVNKAKKLIKWAKEKKEDKKDKEDEENKEEPIKEDDFLINFEGDLVVTDDTGEEIVRFEAREFSDEDLKAFNAKDVEYFTKKLKKLEDIGLILKQEPSTDMDMLESTMIPDEELTEEIPEEMPELPEQSLETLEEEETEETPEENKEIIESEAVNKVKKLIKQSILNISDKKNAENNINETIKIIKAILNKCSDEKALKGYMDTVEEYVSRAYELINANGDPEDIKNKLQISINYLDKALKESGHEAYTGQSFELEIK